MYSNTIQFVSGSPVEVTTHHIPREQGCCIYPTQGPEVSLCSSLPPGTLAEQIWGNPSAAMTHLLQTTPATARIWMEIETNSNWTNFLNQELRFQRTQPMWLCCLLLWQGYSLCVKGNFIITFWRSVSSNTKMFLTLTLFVFSIQSTRCSTP